LLNWFLQHQTRNSWNELLLSKGRRAKSLLVVWRHEVDDPLVALDPSVKCIKRCNAVSAFVFREPRDRSRYFCLVDNHRAESADHVRVLLVVRVHERRSGNAEEHALATDVFREMHRQTLDDFVDAVYCSKVSGVVARFVVTLGALGLGVGLW
jgi:hypothetical protein